MPFVPFSMTGMMVVKGASIGMSGQKFMPTVSAVSSATCQYLTAAPLVVSTNNVLGPGSGVYTGRIVGVVPQNMATLMLVQAAAMGIAGKETRKLFDAISFGVCNTLMTTGMAQGFVIGGGPGVGQGKILNLVPTALLVLIMANMAAKGLVGQSTAQIMQAVSFGICTNIMTVGSVVTTCIGAAAPPPAGTVMVPGAPGPGRLI